VRIEIVILEQFVGLLYLFPAALLSLIVTIRVHSLQNFGRWMGAALIFSGLIALVPLLIVPLATIDGLLSLSNSVNTNPLEASLGAGFYYSILTQFGSPVLLQAAALLIIGFVLLAISMLVQRPVDSTLTPTSAAITVPGQNGET
jgi:hypothetical protein